MFYSKVTSICISLLIGTTVFSQPGSLVSDFGNGGIFRPSTPNFQRLNDIDYLDDGTIIACGTAHDVDSDGALLRISPFGEVEWEFRLDPSNSDIIDRFESLVIVDHNIFVQENFLNPASGKAEIRVTKLDLDGKIDTTFGDFGSTIIDYSSPMEGWQIIADDHDNLYITGTIYELDQGVVIKLNTMGEIDMTFGDSGLSIQPYQNFRSGLTNALVWNNEVYAIGWYRGKNPEDVFDANALIVKLSESGERITEFGENGFLTVDVDDPTYLADIAAFGPSHILFLTDLQGTNEGSFIHKIDLDGKRDLEFGTNGTIEYNFGQAEFMEQLSVDRELGIYITGRVGVQEDLAIAKLLPEGSPDERFAEDGFLTIDIEGELRTTESLLSTDGNLLIAGYVYDKFNTDFLLVKLEAVPTCRDTIEQISLEGCDLVEYDGTTYLESGQHDLTYTSARGCDSTIMLDVLVNLSTQSNMSLESCEAVTINDETYSTTGIYNQTLTNSMGCDSVLTLDITIGEASSETFSTESCEAITINNETYSTTGTYMQTLVNAAGCDSVLTIELQIQALEANVSLSDQTLTSQTETATINWYDCDGDTIIEGESAPNFTPSLSGSYALILSNELCTDTSDCFSVEVTSNLDEYPLSSELLAFPNPTQRFAFIEKPTVATRSHFLIYDSQGRSFQVQHFEDKDVIRIDFQEIPPGLYYIHLFFNERPSNLLKIIKK